MTLFKTRLFPFLVRVIRLIPLSCLYIKYEAIGSSQSAQPSIKETASLALSKGNKVHLPAPLNTTRRWTMPLIWGCAHFFFFFSFGLLVEQNKHFEDVNNWHFTDIDQAINQNLELIDWWNWTTSRAWICFYINTKSWVWVWVEFDQVFTANC